MESFWIVTLFQLEASTNERNLIEQSAFENFEALGIEEFSLSEAEVDEILGERSYSGGDLPQIVLDEVEERVLRGPVSFRFFFNTREPADNFRAFVKTRFLCEAQIEENLSEDWNAEWKKHYAPIRVNEMLEIVPSWSKDLEPMSEKQIFIYPGMGFGTGSHETTFLCLKLFTEKLLNLKTKKVLDFGAGSGILGLSVFKFFPDVKVDFYDIDPEANRNCYQNAIINGLEDSPFRLLLPEVREKLQVEYDLVFANILESVLISEIDALIKHTCIGGHLIVSGLLRHQAKGIIERYSKKGMELIIHEEKGDWAAILFKRDH